MVTHPSHFFRSMTMHQARTFSFVAAVLAVLSAALTRLNAGRNGDDRTASKPAAPTDLVINWRLVKRLGSGTDPSLLSIDGSSFLDCSSCLLVIRPLSSQAFSAALVSTLACWPHFNNVSQIMPIAALEAPLIPTMVVLVNQHIPFAHGATLKPPHSLPHPFYLDSSVSLSSNFSTSKQGVPLLAWSRATSCRHSSSSSTSLRVRVNLTISSRLSPPLKAKFTIAPRRKLRPDPPFYQRSNNGHQDNHR